VNRCRLVLVLGLVGMNMSVATPSARAGEKQSGWRRCTKCEALFNGPEFEASVCPAGKHHNLEDDGFYLVGFVEPLPRNWRYCAKCKGLWFDGSNDKGKCPAGERHTSEGSSEYVVEADDTGRGNWCRCTKCQVLWFAGDGTGGKCAAGGRHVKDEKVKYKLDQEPSFPTLPVSGKAAPGVELLDMVMLKYLKKLGCSGASLTVTRSHQPGPHGWQPTTDHAPLYSRGYGWCDLKGTVPMHPDTAIGIGSCDKSFIAAAIRQMALEGKLDLNGSLFKQLKITPKGKIVDNRVWDITINHLLDHQAGWQGEPWAQGQAAAGDPTQFLSPYEWTMHTLENVMVQKLRDPPGHKAEYDNWGYFTLATVVDRLSGVSFGEYLSHHICRPFGVDKLLTVRITGPARISDPHRVWNASAEGSGWPFVGERATEPHYPNYTTPAMCTFMRYFWIDGRPRDNWNPTWVRAGSFTNSLALMFWRSDGINFAVAFNGRRELEGDWGKELDDMISKLIALKLLPPPPQSPRNLLINGSFEQGPVVSGYLPVDSGSTAIKGWKVTRGQIDVNETNYNSADGKRSIDLHGTPGYGGVEQSFKTIKGHRYRVTFSMSGAPAYAVAIKRLAVSAAGKSQEFAFDTTDKKPDDMGWIDYAWEFNAIDESTNLEIRTVMTTDPLAGPFIDHVRVWDVPATK